jgi:2'-5' RNA ligase
MNQTATLNAVRAFVAFELPDKVVTAVRDLQSALKALKFDARWVRTQNLHLTLKFLGDIDPGRVESVRHALGLAVGGIAPITLGTRGLGAFPGIRRARVLWVGIAGEVERLLGLQREIDRNLALIGFPAEQRPFRAHLTLGRVTGKIDARQLLEAIQRFQDSRSDFFQVQRIQLLRSELKPDGPEYTNLATVALG